MISIRTKFRGIFFCCLALTIIGSLIFSLRQNKQNEITNSEILNYFATDQVKEYELDLGTGDLRIMLRQDNKIILYRVPNVGLFVEQIDDHIREYNKANPDTAVLFDLTRPKDTPWWISFLPTLFLASIAVIFVLMWALKRYF